MISPFLSVSHHFYSQTEDVLATFPGSPSEVTLQSLMDSQFSGAYAWAVQEKAKGRKLSIINLGIGYVAEPGSDYGGWGFNLNDGYLPAYPIWYEVDDGIRRVKTPAEIGAVTPDLLAGVPYSPLFKSGWGGFDPSNPSQVQVITDSQYFTGPSWILGLYQDGSGDTTASDPDKRAQLLAEFVPAVSDPAGCQPIQNMKERNYNMPVQFADQIHWPRPLNPDQQNIPSWHHSDMRDVAYVYLFGQLVSISNQ